MSLKFYSKHEISLLSISDIKIMHINFWVTNISVSLVTAHQMDIPAHISLLHIHYTDFLFLWVRVIYYNLRSVTQCLIVIILTNLKLRLTEVTAFSTFLVHISGMCHITVFIIIPFSSLRNFRYFKVIWCCHDFDIDSTVFIFMHNSETSC